MRRKITIENRTMKQSKIYREVKEKKKKHKHILIYKLIYLSIYSILKETIQNISNHSAKIHSKKYMFEVKKKRFLQFFYFQDKIHFA